MVSILNGLSALGTGVSAFAGSAALELQKSQLANQSAILADQLATTRETALEGQRQTFQTGLEGQRQTFQAGQTQAEIAARAAQSGAEIAARASEGAATRASEMARTQAEINKPTDLERTFRFLHLNPDGSPMTGDSEPNTSAAPAPTPSPTPATPSSSTPIASTGTTDSTTTGQTADASGTTGAPTPGATPPTPKADATQNPIVRKAIGLPPLGSPEETRRAIAVDVNADPLFKYKTAGQKAIETEQRVAIAEGKMTDPASREVMAHAIAGYQKAPLDNMAMTKPGSPETMSRVFELNPDYQESRYPEVNKAMSAFGSGKEGDQVRYLDVGVQHMQVFDEAVKALASGDIPKLNAMSNWFRTNYGVSAPTTLAGLKQIVTGEIQRAATGGMGTEADRANLQKSLDEARSPQQLQDMTNGFRALLTGQLRGLKRQYESSTGFKDGPFAFDTKLDPETLKVLNPSAAPAPAPTPVGNLGLVRNPDGTVGTPPGPRTVYTDSGPVDVPAIPAPRAAAPNVIRYDAQGNRVSP